MTTPIAVSGWVIRHRFRDGLYLGSNGKFRDWPCAFSKIEDTENVMERIPPELQPDWELVVVQITEAK